MLVKWGAQVTLPKRGDDCNNQFFCIFGPAGHLQRRPGGSTGGNANQKAFFTRHFTGSFHGIIIRDANDLIINRGIEHIWDKTSPDPLNLVFSFLPHQRALANHPAQLR